MYTLVQAHAYWNTQSGEFKHRIQWPGDALARTGLFQVENLHLYHPDFWDKAVAADVLVLHFLNQDEVSCLIRARAHDNRPTVYEIPDNFLSLGSFADDSLRDPRLRQNVFYYTSQCQGVQFTTEELARRFSFTHGNRIVLPNQMPEPPQPIRHRSGPFVFGWGGSHSHTDDLAYMAEAVVSFCGRHRDVVFAYMGNPENFERYFHEVDNRQKRYTPFGSMADYQRFIERLHVGIAVVSPSDFTNCRSDVKYLEYAGGGAAPVLSDAPLYQEHGRDASRGRLFANPEQLLAVLEDLYQNPQKRESIASAAHTYVQTRTHDAHVYQRANFYRDLLGERKPSGPAEKARNADTALQQVLTLAPLLGGEDREKILTALHMALAQTPHHPYLQFCALKTRYQQGRDQWPALLQELAVRDCPPLYADRIYHMACEMAREGTHEDLFQLFLSRLGDPVRRIYLTEDPTEGARFYRKILEENPFEFHALLNLARLLGDRRVVGEEAEALIIRACLILPEAPDLQALRRKIQSAIAERKARRTKRKTST